MEPALLPWRTAPADVLVLNENCCTDTRNGARFGCKGIGGQDRDRGRLSDEAKRATNKAVATKPQLRDRKTHSRTRLWPTFARTGTGSTLDIATQP